MIPIVGSTRLSARQVRWEEIFSVKRVLASRGFEVIFEEDASNTLLPAPSWKQQEANLIFQVYDDPSKRDHLSNLAGTPANQPTGNEIDELLKKPGFVLTQASFARTFEWYVGELLTRRFGAFASSFGVEVANIIRNSDGAQSGDFDVLSVLGTMELLYIECKTGTFSKKKLMSMVERSRSIHAMACVMFAQTLKPLALKKMTEALNYPGVDAKVPLKRMAVKGLPNSAVFKWYDAFFVSGATGPLDVTAKLRTVLRAQECKRAEVSRGSDASDDDYRASGYEVEEV